MSSPLPVHGFVLAGGKSSRMGQDKALLHFGGQPMVQIAVEKLREFCAEVCIAGDRDDLSGFARVVQDARSGTGPAAGIEAGLQAARQPWALFIPVDVPLVPAHLLRRWAAAALARCSASYLVVADAPQPAFCIMRRECLPALAQALEQGERRLERLLDRLCLAAAPDGRPWRCDVSRLVADDGPPLPGVVRWFANLNTPDDLADATWQPRHPNEIS